MRGRGMDAGAMNGPGHPGFGGDGSVSASGGMHDGGRGGGNGYSQAKAQQQGRSGYAPNKSIGDHLAEMGAGVASLGFLDYSTDPARAEAPIDFTPARGIAGLNPFTGLAAFGARVAGYPIDDVLGTRMTLNPMDSAPARPGMLAQGQRGQGRQANPLLRKVQAQKAETALEQASPSTQALARALRGPGYTHARKGTVIY